MKLTSEQIKNVTVGASHVTFEDGLYKFFRYTDREYKTESKMNMLIPAGIQLYFKTDGNILNLKVETRAIDVPCTYFSFDIIVNGRLAGTIQNAAEEDLKGNYGYVKFPLGKFQGEFELGKGEKTVRIVLPHSTAAYIEEVEITGATYIEPVKRNKTLVAYGDSITQGYFGVHPSKTYAVRIADALDAELYNKAFGGAGFSPNLVEASDGIRADYVIVAYGTNDWGGYDKDFMRKNTQEFFCNIQKIYPDTPTYVITPIWRSDWEKEKKGGLFSDVENTITEIFSQAENVTIVPGRDLVPHDTSLFGDLWLHPGDKGMEYYYNNLIKFITKEM
ncbi:MAG: SGNH/GDSL hydrolase family protein [Clostridia bacterium]|nr:SGNH/GDSL hydrolase family protein [Clostridia bacterium]